MPGSTITPRVLSIQSHVVHGYVGSKCAVLPLNRLGLEVDAINSVQFSNHTGYPQFTGQVLDGDGLTVLVDGLEANGLLRYTHLLTGYIGSLSLLETIASVVQRLRRVNPDLIYVCDPVQGDDGRLYCQPDLPDAYRTLILPIASIITPNQFEAEILCGLTIHSETEALAACKALHHKGPHTVIITSLNLPESPGWVTLLASTTLEQDNGCNAIKLRVPRVDAYFTGTGDLLTALLLAWLHRQPRDLKSAVEKAVAGLQTVLQDTVKYSKGVDGERDANVCAARELRLVQNQDALAVPAVIYEALPFDVAWPEKD